MNDNKFRAWVNKLKVMILPKEICYIAFTEGNGAIVHEFGEPVNAVYEDVILLQYTGLNDKNGKDKEIFCSDVIGSFNGLLYEVYWSQTAAQWRVKWLNTRFIGKDAGSLRAMLKNHYAIVKGNIHENPELCK